MNRKAVEDLLDAVRDVPVWHDQPSAEARERWHNKRLGIGCDLPGCTANPCYCEHAEAESMEWRERATGEPYVRVRRLYERFNVEFDTAAPEVGELILSDGWVPNENRERLIAVLVRLAAGRPAGVLDHKARAVLVALEEPAESLAEVAERTRSPAVSFSTTKKLSKALQQRGLVRREPDGTWTRTDEGARVLGT
jgi:hypothetical protein